MDIQRALTIAGVFRQRHNFYKYLIAPISFQRRAMRWLRWVVLAVLVPSVVAGVTLARASTEQPREKVVGPPHDIPVLLMVGAFDEIEAIANDYRSSRIRMAGGYSALLNFYDILTRFYDQGDCWPSKAVPAYTFDEKRQALERWLAAHPNSLTARIALASLWQHYAWTGRGCGYADKTGAAQWSSFNERMARADELLQPLDPDADPEIYAIEMNAALAAERPKDKLLNLYGRASRAYPDIQEFAAKRFRFTLPRWFGEPGEAAAFTRSLLTAPGGEAGLMAYFNVAGETLTIERRYAAVFDVSGAEYPWLVRAFAARVAAFGVTKHDMNVLLYYAIAAKNCATINTLIEKIGDDWDYAIWTDKAYIDDEVRWLKQKCTGTPL
jgi:hypothetical protein